LSDVVYPLSLEGLMFLPGGKGSDLGPELLDQSPHGAGLR